MSNTSLNECKQIHWFHLAQQVVMCTLSVPYEMQEGLDSDPIMAHSHPVRQPSAATVPALT